MIRVWAIFKREFMGYFNSLVAYFFLVLFFLAVNMIFIRLSFFQTRVANMKDYFEFFKMAMWLFLPAITMKMWAEEKKMGTLELLMTMPVKDGEAVLGKFMASLGFLALALVLSFLTIPVAIEMAGDPDWGPIIGGYLGLLLLGATLISIGLAISSMTENQFIAFILTSIITLVLMACYELSQLTPLPSWLSTFIMFIDAGEHYTNFSRGIIDSRDLIYYLSIIGLALFLNYRAVTSRRWK